MWGVCLLRCLCVDSLNLRISPSPLFCTIVSSLTVSVILTTYILSTFKVQLAAFTILAKLITVSKNIMARSSPIWSKFKALIKGDLIVPTDSSYRKSIGRWSRLAEREAAAVVFVKDEEDVAMTVELARENDMELAVKGELRRP